MTATSIETLRRREVRTFNARQRLGDHMETATADELEALDIEDARLFAILTETRAAIADHEATVAPEPATTAAPATPDAIVCAWCDGDFPAESAGRYETAISATDYGTTYERFTCAACVPERWEALTTALGTNNLPTYRDVPHTAPDLDAIMAEPMYPAPSEAQWGAMATSSDPSAAVAAYCEATVPVPFVSDEETLARVNAQREADGLWPLTPDELCPVCRAGYANDQDPDDRWVCESCADAAYETLTTPTCDTCSGPVTDADAWSTTQDDETYDGHTCEACRYAAEAEADRDAREAGAIPAPPVPTAHHCYLCDLEDEIMATDINDWVPAHPDPVSAILDDLDAALADDTAWSPSRSAWAQATMVPRGNPRSAFLATLYGDHSAPQGTPRYNRCTICGSAGPDIHPYEFPDGPRMICTYHLMEEIPELDDDQPGDDTPLDGPDWPEPDMPAQWEPAYHDLLDRMAQPTTPLQQEINRRSSDLRKVIEDDTLAGRPVTIAHATGAARHATIPPRPSRSRWSPVTTPEPEHLAWLIEGDAREPEWLR